MGKCKVCGKNSWGSYCYAHWIAHDSSQSKKWGRHRCPGGCGTMITKDRSMCWRCRTKKKSSFW